MSIPEDMRLPLNDMAYLLECAALGYTGEVKSELSVFCERVRSKQEGFTAAQVQSALPELDACVTDYRSDRRPEAISGLVRLSRRWWASILG